MGKGSCMSHGGKVHPMKKGGKVAGKKAPMGGMAMASGAMDTGMGAMPPMKKMRKGGLTRGR